MSFASPPADTATRAARRRDVAWWVAVGVAAAWASAPARAGAEGAAPAVVAAKLFCKVITYDTGLPPDVVRVGVVFPASQAASGAAVMAAFATVKDMRIKGRALELVEVAYGKPDDIASVASSRGLYGLFVVDSTPDQDVPAIRAAAKKLGLLTFAHNPAHVEQGFAVGVRESGGSRAILLNRSVAQEQRRMFDGSFLGACTIVGT